MKFILDSIILVLYTRSKGNGFFANWDEVLLHKEELLNFLKEQIISFPKNYDVSSISDNLLARLLPAVFSKITFEDSAIHVFPLVPYTMLPISIRVDGYQTNLPEHPISVCSLEAPQILPSDMS